MKEKIEPFILQMPDFNEKSPSEFIDYFVYFLTIIEGGESIQACEVEACFALTRLQKYSNIPAYLSKNSKSTKKRKAKFIKSRDGYQLEKSHQLEIQKSLHSGPAKIETSHLLRSLLSRLCLTNEQAFLQEAIDCYEIGARRASIVIVWILTVCHLCEYIFKNELHKFNSILSKNTDKRIKIKKILKIDDFSEIPESKFIEFARSAKIITNDIRKILDEKLGIRNSSAHPSGISISEVKATDFIIDLVNNVILKYKI